jgi:hypothetical protein
MRLSRTITLLIALSLLAPGLGPTVAAAADAVDKLSVGLFSELFLASTAARIEADRTERERIDGGYLQEETGLLWARADNREDLDWYAAGDYCTELEVADWTDWRMPTIEELEGLHEKRSSSTYKLPPEIRLSGCCPWSSTRNGDASAWNFSFRYRKRFSGSLNYSFELRALCVREASEDDVLFFERIAEESEEDD